MVLVGCENGDIFWFTLPNLDNYNKNDINGNNSSDDNLNMDDEKQKMNINNDDNMDENSDIIINDVDICDDNEDDKIIIYAKFLRKFPNSINDLIFVDFDIRGNYLSCLRSSWDIRHGGVGVGLPVFTPALSNSTGARNDSSTGSCSSSTYNNNNDSSINNDNINNKNNSTPFPPKQRINPLSTHLCVISGGEIHCFGIHKVSDIVCGDEYIFPNKLYDFNDKDSLSQLTVHDKSEYIGTYNYCNNISVQEKSAFLVLRYGKLYASILHPDTNDESKIILSANYVVSTDSCPYILGCKIISRSDIIVNDANGHRDTNSNYNDNTSIHDSNSDNKNRNDENEIHLKNNVKFIIEFLNCSTGTADTVTLHTPEDMSGDDMDILAMLRSMFDHSIEKNTQKNTEYVDLNNINTNYTFEKAIPEIISAIDKAVSTEQYMKNKIKVFDIETLQMVALLSLLDENYSSTNKSVNLNLSVDLKNINSTLSKYIKVERTLRSELGSSGIQIGGMLTYLDFKIVCLNKVSMRALHGRCLTITCMSSGPQCSMYNAVTSYSRDLQFSVCTVNNKDSYSCSLSVPIELSRISTYNISLSIHISYLTPELELYSQNEFTGNQPMFFGLGLNSFDSSSTCGKILEIYESVLTLEEVYTVLNNESMTIQNAFVSTMQSIVCSPSIRELSAKQRKKHTFRGHSSGIRSGNTDKGVIDDRKTAAKGDDSVHEEIGMKNEEFTLSLSIPYLHSQQYNQHYVVDINNQNKDNSLLNQKLGSHDINVNDNNNDYSNKGDTHNTYVRNVALNSDNKMSSKISNTLNMIQTNMKSTNNLSYHNKYTNMNTPKGFLGHLHPILNSKIDTKNSNNFPFYLSVRTNTVACVGVKNQKNSTLGSNNHVFDTHVLELIGSPSLLSSISSIATKKALDYLNVITNNDTINYGNDTDHRKSTSTVENLIHSTIFSEKDIYSLPHKLQKVMVASSVLVKELNIKMTKNGYNPNRGYDDTEVLDGGLDYVRMQTIKLWELYYIIRSMGC